MNTYEYLAEVLAGADPPVDRETVRRAVEALQAGQPQDPSAARQRINLLIAITGICLRRYERSAEPDDLEDAVSAARSTVELDVDRTAAPVAHSNLAVALRRRYERHRHADDLDEALAAARTAAECTAADVERGAILLNLAGILRIRADSGDDGREEVLHTLRDALRATPQDSPHLLTIRSDTLRAEIAHAAASGTIAELEALLDDASRLVDDIPEGHHQLPKALANVAEARRVLYNRGAGTHHLTLALESLRAAEQLQAGSGPEWPPLASLFGAMLVQSYERNGDPTQLGEAIELFRRAAARAQGHESAQISVNLAGALHSRYARYQSVDDLGEALVWARNGLAAYRPGQRHHPAAAVNLAAILVADHRLRGGLPALEEAVTVLRSAQTPGLSRELRAQISANLATTLRLVYQRLGRPADLDGAVEAAASAVDLTPADDERYPRFASVLGSVVRGRYEATGDEADLEQAVRWSRTALAATLDDHGEWPRQASHLSLALLRRFERFGEEADLDDGVALATRVVDRLDPASSLGLRARANLGDALRQRYEYAGELSDLDDAVGLLREVVSATKASATALPARAAGLGALLLRRFEATSRTADIDEAVRVFGFAACRTTATDPARSMFLSDLGLAHFRRYESSTAVRDLRAAVAYGRAALRAAAPATPIVAGYQSNLIGRLLALDELSPDPAALREAAALAEAAAAAMKPEYQGAAGVQFNCGLAYEAQAVAGVGFARAKAVEAFRRCAEQASAPPLWRAMAAGQQGRLASDDEDWQQACETLTASIMLLPRVAHRSLTRVSRQTRLSRVDGVGRLAAAAALHLGDPSRALSLLEQGRCVILGQDLDYRGEFGKVLREDTESAKALDRLRNILGADDTVAPNAVPPNAPAADSETPARTALTGSAQRRRDAADEWDRLVADLRLRPALRRLFLPPDPADLAVAARGGLVVAVNVAPSRCDALVLSEEGLMPPVPLPVTEKECRASVNALLDALDDRDWGTNGKVLEHLRWLWERVTGPILDAVGLTGTPSDGRARPRIWWMPTGALTLAPLHAAGHHDDPGPERRSVLDRADSSYTPTIRALAHSRAQETEAFLHPMVVGVRDTPGQERLTRAADEAAWVAGQLNAARVLVDAQASSSEVTAGLLDCGWLHFAGHSVTDPSDASRNALLLPAGDLRVGDLAALHNPRAHLAYLSSCTTARPGARLPDESIHVASSMQLAGFAHIVGTLWKVGDDASYDAARVIYPQLLRNPADPAAGVNTAIRMMRDEFPRNPLYWAAHVHIGA